jgi:hypothetical protein
VAVTDIVPLAGLDADAITGLGATSVDEVNRFGGDRRRSQC